MFEEFEKALSRFKLTEPVSFDDMNVIAAHLRKTFPGKSVEITHGQQGVLVSVGSCRLWVKPLPHS